MSNIHFIVDNYTFRFKDTPTGFAIVTSNKKTKAEMSITYSTRYTTVSNSYTLKPYTSASKTIYGANNFPTCNVDIKTIPNTYSTPLYSITSNPTQINFNFKKINEVELELFNSYFLNGKYYSYGKISSDSS